MGSQQNLLLVQALAHPREQGCDFGRMATAQRFSAEPLYLFRQGSSIQLALQSTEPRLRSVQAEAQNLQFPKQF
jgi:hypothetical protein